MDNATCPSCSNADTREACLLSAARHPALKGSRFVGSRGVRDLLVCRECCALWHTWYDRREGYQCWRSHGRSIVAAFAADTSLTRLLDWVASDYLPSSFGLVDALATRLIRRRPEGLREGMSALMRHVGNLVPPAEQLDAERLYLIFHLMGLVVDRVIRGDLRPPGPRVKPPTRYRDAEVEEAACDFRPREVDGLTRLPRTHDTVRRLMWERRWGGGPDSPDRAVIAIHDLSPLLRFLEDLPLDVVDDGTLRGVIAECAFKASAKLHSRCRLPENDHAIWMPREDWLALERRIDPLERLAASFRRIQKASSMPLTKGLSRFLMESVLVREPIRSGARFTDFARRELGSIAGRYPGIRSDSSSRAHEALLEILDCERAASEADARCVLFQG